MRIAMVASDYAPTVGGVQTAVRNIAHHATQMGHAVIVLSYQPSADVPAREILDGVPVYRFPWGRRPILTLPFRFAWTLIGMARVLLDFKPDLVYIHFLTINALYVLLLHYLLRFRLIASARGNDIQGIPLRSRGQRWMLAHLFQRADAVLFCSSFVQRDAAPYLRRVSPRAFVGVVGDGFEADEFAGRTPFRLSAGLTEPYLLGMGRLVYKKGFDLLVEAFCRLAGEFPKLHLLIAGDGDERPRLEEYIAQLHMQDRVHLLGFTDRDRTIALFLGCDFFVLSSRVEPFGIVVLEAMAAHKAVLATKSGGVVDLVQNGVNGILVDPTVEDLERGMRGLLLQPAETRAMGERAVQSIQARTWAAVTRQFIEVFEHVLGSRA